MKVSIEVYRPMNDVPRRYCAKDHPMLQNKFHKSLVLTVDVLN